MSWRQGELAALPDSFVASKGYAYFSTGNSIGLLAQKCRDFRRVERRQARRGGRCSPAAHDRRLVQLVVVDGIAHRQCEVVGSRALDDRGHDFDLGRSLYGS